MDAGRADGTEERLTGNKKQGETEKPTDNSVKKVTCASTKQTAESPPNNWLEFMRRKQRLTHWVANDSSEEGGWIFSFSFRK